MPFDSDIADRRQKEPWWQRTLRETAIHDFAVFAFLLFLNGEVLGTPNSAERSFCLVRTGGLFMAFLISIVLVRGRLLKRSWVAALVYRLGIYGVVQVSYFFLKHVLPLVNTTTLDQKLYDLDLALFHCEPAMLWDRYVTPATTEWFAFFYFGYFLLMAVHVVPLLFFGRKSRSWESSRSRSCSCSASATACTWSSPATVPTEPWQTLFSTRCPTAYGTT